MIRREDLPAKPVNLNQGTVAAKRAEIKAYFNQTYTTYESLFETLASDAAFYERPCSLRHPLIFYFGHTATFFTNKLILAKLLPKRINPKIESTCAIGVDEMSWDDLNDAHYDWPSVTEVRNYRKAVQAAVNQLIDTVEFSLPIDWQSPMWPIMMGIEHERIHLETSSVLIRQLPISSVKSSPLYPVCPQNGTAPSNQCLSVPAGLVKIDHQDPAQSYGWDNEYGHHQADVAEFKASQFLVSNQEYLEFVEAGGYDTPDYWSDEGNRWRLFSPVKHPTFWVKNNHTLKGIKAWSLRCMTEEIAMPWDWPVEVNFLEAEAFCRWKALQTGLPIRLPSEDEYLRLADFTQAQKSIAQANVNLQHFASSTPVTQFKTGEFYDVVGNVWQWTQTPIYPFDGFKVHPLYDDFTTPTFDNKHNIFKGGSWISSGNEINGHSRYAFRRHFFQHAGFRYVESATPVQTEFAVYETDADIIQACEAHYGESVLGIGNFQQAYAHLAQQAIQADANLESKSDLKILEVGCSVGRAAFELAKTGASVTALDFSARFIQVANQLQETGSVHYTLPLEGEIVDFKEQSLAALGLAECAHQVQFLQQDAANLKDIFIGYDLIVSANHLETMANPQAFLKQCHERLNAGGLLLIGSTYQWPDKHQANWLGGYKDAHSGENVTSLEGITELLQGHFELVNAPLSLPLIKRHNQRHFDYELSEFTLWKKKA
ncbi:5-histidylcysteine sulfoxide synthase [Thiosulfativibrio zosterae]|uniref:SAM-dependent methyltransferase n=1 Tax=Thiosulfativibrio zosterae TaxID=2675053 RepID=A0A6F8PQN5_9GAMM|nr:5-histidylcysteine sulfoxide synthase [Thiosulfativibrio zosterae]BBP44442.1 SAM-dependent methyltransferase [Thiosulfativibrio zosterae]